MLLGTQQSHDSKIDLIPSQYLGWFGGRVGALKVGALKSYILQCSKSTGKHPVLVPIFAIATGGNQVAGA